MGLPPHAVPTRMELSPEEKAAYRRLADALLHNTLRDYDAFCMDNPARRVGSLDWKLVKTQDGISVYKECRPTSSRKDAPFVPRLLTADGRYERVDANISVPRILVTGTMRGSVEDAIHGAFVDGPESHAKRGFYIHDRSSDFRVLAQLDGPTDDDPYRFCGIAWTEMGGAGMPFVKRRDLLTLVASGLMTRADGEQVGYYIIHSISHQQVKPLTEFKLLRAKCSFCYLFCQQNMQGLSGGIGSQVETYQKGFFAPLGDVPERGVVSAVVRTVIAPSRLVDAGYNRKLCFLLKHAPPSRRTSTDDDECDDDLESGCAGGCSRRRSDSFFSSSGLGSSGGPLRKLAQQNQSQGLCVVCKLNVCSTCKVVKKLAVEANGYDLVVKSLGFCLVCVNKAKTLSAPLLARQELAEKNAQPHERPFAGVSPNPSKMKSPFTEMFRFERKTSRARSADAGDIPDSRSMQSPLMDQPPAQRKPSWAGPGVAELDRDTRGVRSPLIGRGHRKASWQGPETIRAPPTTRSPLTDKPRVDRKTSWVGSSHGSFSSDEGSGRTRSPHPAGHPQHSIDHALHRKAAWMNPPEIAERRHVATQDKQSYPMWQTVDNGRAEHAAPNAGLSAVSQENQPVHGTSRPRRRIDERVAIEDIAVRGILL